MSHTDTGTGAITEIILALHDSVAQGSKDTRRKLRYMRDKFLMERAKDGEVNAQMLTGLVCQDLDEPAEAAKWYQMAAEQGDATAQAHLAGMYRTGEGVERDEVAGAYWLEKAAEQGIAPAQLALGIAYSLGQGVATDDAQAFSWFHMAAERGIAQAQVLVGEDLRDGRGVEQDYAQAVAWFRRAAEQSSAEAQTLLGISYREGLGVEQDDAKALEWLGMAAAQDDPKAAYYLGLSYLEGRGVAEDGLQGLDWLRKAAAKGFGMAEMAIGVHYELGAVVPRDIRKAVAWYELAAAHGDRYAPFRLGNLYLLGRGVTADPGKARKWLSMAADARVADAEYALAGMYESGVGVVKDAAKASELYRRAAEHGSTQAAERLEQPAAPNAGDSPAESPVRATDELKALVGLETVKREVAGLQALLWLQRERREMGLRTIPPVLHMVFTGGPGTGKTTVARIVAKVFRETGILSKGHLVEVDRTSLVGGYLGQTALRTTETVRSALDGVLFIDEAYSLVARNAGFEDSYGQEAISTLLKLMEDNRHRLAVIVAGYPEEMEAFLESNPGIRSRFPTHIDFPNYTAEELGEIFRRLLERSDLRCTAPALEMVDGYLARALKMADPRTFGNAREVGALIEEAERQLAVRLSKSHSEKRTHPAAAELRTLTVNDFEFLKEVIPRR